MARPPKNSPSFFKVFNQNRSSDKLQIPSMYTLQMLGSLPWRASLRDRYRNHWPVKLAYIKDQLYFTEGWAKFVEDNSIVDGDFLFFQYNDNKVFYVKITGKNACDKKGVGALMSKGKEKEPLEVETIDEEKEEASDELMEEQDNQSLDEQVDEKKRGKGKISKQIKSLKRKVEKPESKGPSKSFQKTAIAKHSATKARDYYDADIFKSGILSQPKNPYFLTKIRPNRREELYIPVDVLKVHSIEKLPNKATLRDSSGRTWSTKLSRWSDGRNFYVGGWSSFCKLNLVGDDDRCICEFVKEGDQKDLILQLQVVPTINNVMIWREN